MTNTDIETQLRFLHNGLTELTEVINGQIDLHAELADRLARLEAKEKEKEKGY